MSATIPKQASVLSVGWGRLLFAHTFPDASSLAQALMDEEFEKRDIAFYVTDPQLVIAEAPQDLFLDPSTTYRLQLDEWTPKGIDRPVRVTSLQRPEELDEVNQIYLSADMVPVTPERVWQSRDDERYGYRVARPLDSDKILGVALEVDHALCFDDLMNSCSLWALAVDANAELPGVGSALVSDIASRMKDRGRTLLDLSVMQDNEAAIALYESMGFEKVPVLTIKRRNHINEPLFVPHEPCAGFNPYASIIIQEALRRGIAMEPVDPPRGYFRLVLGNRRVTCCESLSDLTSAIAFCRCSDKQLTQEILAAAGLQTPQQMRVGDSLEEAFEFLAKFNSVVVKPAVGEQGMGVAVDIRDQTGLAQAVAAAREHHDSVLVEQFVEGDDLRVIVINSEVVAAAVRRPPRISGDGRHTARELIERLSRRRNAATEGESQIPIDAETERCLQAAGFGYDDVLEVGEQATVRRTANLHTGGTIEDVTPQISPAVREAAVLAAQAIEIPVVGLDFIVPDIAGDDYRIIEANERPGLANHEPQPTAEKFIDLLFPHTIPPHHAPTLRTQG